MAKNHEIRIKLTGEEHSKIKQKAEKVSMTMSAFLKYLGLNSTIKVALVE